MTTRSSPIQVLKAQADKIARAVKASGRDECKCGVVMDDKTIVLNVTDVKNIPEKILAEYILTLMQEG